MSLVLPCSDDNTYGCNCSREIDVRDNADFPTGVALGEISRSGNDMVFILYLISSALLAAVSLSLETFVPSPFCYSQVVRITSNWCA
jgi:hypothetical protein